MEPDDSPDSTNSGRCNTAEFVVRGCTGTEVFRLAWPIENEVDFGRTVAQVVSLVCLRKEQSATDGRSAPITGNQASSRLETSPKINCITSIKQRVVQPSTSSVAPVEDESGNQEVSNAASSSSTGTNEVFERQPDKRMGSGKPTKPVPDGSRGPQLGSTGAKHAIGGKTDERQLRPRIGPESNVTTYLYDARDKSHWSTTCDWKGFMKDGHRLSIGYILQEARSFPEARLRTADYIGKSGPPKLHLWFEADADLEDTVRYGQIKEFMDYLVIQIGPTDSNIAPPESYGVMKSMAPAAKNTQQAEASKGDASHRPKAGKSDARPKAEDWPAEQQGVRIVVRGCSGNFSYPQIKQFFTEAGADERRVYVQYLEGKRDLLALSFIKGVEKEEIMVFLAVTIFKLGAQGCSNGKYPLDGPEEDMTFPMAAIREIVDRLADQEEQSDGKKRGKQTPLKHMNSTPASKLKEGEAKDEVHWFFQPRKSKSKQPQEGPLAAAGSQQLSDSAIFGDDDVDEEVLEDEKPSEEQT